MCAPEIVHLVRVGVVLPHLEHGGEGWRGMYLMLVRVVTLMMVVVMDGGEARGEARGDSLVATITISGAIVEEAGCSDRICDGG